MKINTLTTHNGLERLIRKSRDIAREQSEMTMSFSKTLDAIMTKQNTYRYLIADETNLSEVTISRMRKTETYSPNKQMVIAVCVALNLTPAEAWALFDKSGNKLRMTDAQDVAYYQILCTCGRYSVDEINEVLIQNKFAPIGGK